MVSMIADASAAILAGGTGTRLGGAAKAFLEIEGRSILARQLEVLRPLFAEVLIIANDPVPYSELGLRVVPDRFPGRGAPGGVHAALEAVSSFGWVFCVACDMPFLQASPIALLAAHRGQGVDAVMPIRRGYYEPLFAFYARTLAAPFGKALSVGAPSLVRLLDAASTVRVSEEEYTRADPGGRSLENVNTPEDLARASPRAPRDQPRR
ncbi:MAG: molybdenum cofactor guanylyltransferase [Deltaproteobacteria bacterium]|nr:molybdenum cofactor guanylyltransferase [Deltaproteobacteria bacterium]